MRNIEIPYEEDRGKRYRFFEMLPGLLSWSILALPFILSQVNPRLCVFFIIAYLLLWFAKVLGLNVRSIQGYRMITQHQKAALASNAATNSAPARPDQPDRHIPAWHYENMLRIEEQPTPIKAKDVVHAIIIATYNEGREVLEPTVQSVLASDYDSKNVILVLAYEGQRRCQVRDRL